MSDSHLSGAALEGLRQHLRAANIPFTEHDLAGIEERGFLRRLHDFAALSARLPSDWVPAYLAAWGESSTVDVAIPASASALSPAVRATSDDLVWVAPNGVNDVRRYGSIADIAGLLRSRAVSPVELTEQALLRIEARDPQINAFQQVLAAEALAAARVAEQEIAAGIDRGPLHGVPLAVKDLLAMAGTTTTAGSKILADRHTHEDAAAVEKLRGAGAVIVGKTRMSEFAYSPGSNNAHYGPTANPWNLSHDTGGSSSGSAAAVADGMVYAALGSDTGGSIRIPAALCGIVGLKPTFGRISLHGAVTLSWSLDHLGPLTRSVGDAALLLEALAGYDGRDPRTRDLPALNLSALHKGATGLRVGVVTNDGAVGSPATAEAQAAFRAGLDALAASGAELVELELPELDDLRLVVMVLLACEAASFHQPTLQTRLDDYGPFMRQRILAAYAFGPHDFVRAQQARAALRQRCAVACANLDIIATPSQPDVAPALGVPASTHYTAPFNALGWPAISVPVALSNSGLPLAIQLAAKPWHEAVLLRAARAVEVGLEM